MHAELTVRTADGNTTDVAVHTSGEPTWAELFDALRRAGVDAEPGWVDDRRIALAAPVGELASGAVLGALPPVPPALPPRLEVVGGLDSDRGIALRHGTITVGRAPDCDLALSDPRVSRHHAIVTTTAAGTTVRDAGSTTGVQLGSEPIDASQPITPSDLLRLGDTYLSLATGGQTGAAPPREDVVVDWPDEPPGGAPIPLQLAAAIVPGVVGAVLALVLHSVELLAFALLCPVAMLATAIVERIRGRRMSRRRRRQLLREREAVQAQVRCALADEVTRRRAAHPDPARLRRSCRDGPSERPATPGGAIAIPVRIGLGSLPASVAVRRNGSVESAGVLADVPVIVDLAADPLIIAAPRRLAAALARWLILQIAATTHPDDVEFAICTTTAASWRWMRWLPHLRSLVASTPRERAELLDRLAERRDNASANPRHIVVVADDPLCARRLFTLAKNANSVSAIVVSGRIGPAAGAATTLRFGCDALAQAHLGAVDCVVDGVGTRWAESFARELAGRRSSRAAGAGMPQSCELAELGLRASAAAITAAWQSSPHHARAVLGIAAGGAVELDLDRDGPHALIAGTTGAGKSELLQTLLVSLAAHSPPRELTLLLFDFKGGAAFAPLADLPHTVGLVTDLDEHLGRRMLRALRSELALRERLLAAAGVADRAGYLATGAPLPRLVLVVDEFAALAEQLSDFVPGLVGVAQRGRSLGVHLILATQRPGSVVSADIRANTDLRIALRTTSAADSIDVVDDAAAASIDPATPGRAYVRSGPRLQIVQCARVGTGASVETVRVQRLDEWNRPLPQPSSTDEPPGARLGGFPDAIRAAAAGDPAPRRPWLPPLPDRVPSDLLPPAAGDALAVPIGLADRPDLQRYDVEVVHLDVGGGVVFTGGPRSGRTSALLTLVTSAATQLAPDELEVHAIVGDAAAALVDQLPHTGTVAELRDGGRLAAELLARLARRAQERAPTDPATVLLIDDWDAWCATADALDHGRSVETVLALIRGGPASRMTVVVAGGRTTLAPRLTALVSTRYVLRLTDAAEYPVAGVDPRDVPTVLPPGRAINGAGVEVQLIDPAEVDQRAAVGRSRWRRPADRLRLRPLPDRVRFDTLPATVPDDRWLLGVGGDDAAPICVDPFAGTRRIVVAGPPGSGRSNVLALLFAQCRPGPTSVIATPNSPLAAAARRAASAVIDPATVADPNDAVPDRCDVLLLDDADELVAEPFGQACADWIRRHPRTVVVAAVRTDTLALAAREPVAELRRTGGGVMVLRPGPLDAHLVGPHRAGSGNDPPGRGVLLPDPAWQFGRQPLPLQIAVAPDVRVSACADIRGRSAERRSP